MEPLFIKVTLNETTSELVPFANFGTAGTNSYQWRTTTVQVSKTTTTEVLQLNPLGVRDLGITLAAVFTIMIIIRCIFRSKK